MSSPVYNNFLTDKFYGMFLTCGKKAQIELMIFNVMNLLRMNSQLNIEPIFYFFILILHMKIPIEFLKKKKGKKRNIIYIPKPVSFRRQIQLPIRYIEKSFKSVNDFIQLPVAEVLFITLSDFFLKEFEYYKDYRKEFGELVVIARINQKRRWK